MRMKKKILIVLAAFFGSYLYSQTAVTRVDNPTTTQINTGLSGPNVTITGGTILLGKLSQIATFTNGTNAGLKMSKGVYFSTGFAATDLSKKNSYIATSNSPSGESTILNDVDLKNLDPNAVYDVISYEFTIKLANTVSGLNIAYQFGSEEYPDYVGSIYNDAFGFFISGPGITGKLNMAKLPNDKNTTINTINAGIRGSDSEIYPSSSYDGSLAANYINNGHTTNTYINNGIQYYVQNPEPQPGPFPIFVEHNGISKLINYSIRNLTPGGTYTFKIIIGDSSDAQRDSGVFVNSISAFADLNANDDNYSFIQGNNITPSILLNDTSNGNVVTSALVSIAGQNVPAGFTINSDGTIVISDTVLPGTYAFNYSICDQSNPIYCKTAKVTIVISAPAACYKPAAKDGVTLDSNHGITSLSRAGKDNGNWPMVRKGAHTVLEAKTKGFVINRLSTTQKNTLNPSLGMAVYDTTLNCLSIYDGTSWKCFNKQTCPINKPALN